MLLRFRPADCRLVVDGVDVAKREPVTTRRATLETVLQSGPGQPLRLTERTTDIHVLEPVTDGET